MKLQFIASAAIISPHPAESRKLFVDALGLPLEQAGPDAEYYYSDKIDGSRHFGVWPLAEAAESCFGSSEWPSDRVVPQVSIEFEVATEAEVSAAAAELESRGYQLVHAARAEPWGQIVARLQTSEGAIVGISYVPQLHGST